MKKLATYARMNMTWLPQSTSSQPSNVIGAGHRLNRGFH
jgi:hypothetical protein